MWKYIIFFNYMREIFNYIDQKFEIILEIYLSEIETKF